MGHEKDSKWIIGGLRRKPYLGIKSKKVDISVDLYGKKEVTLCSGFEIKKIVKDGPFHNAGVKVGDIVFKMGGNTLEKYDSMIEVAKCIPQDRFYIEILRNHSIMKKFVQTMPRPLEEKTGYENTYTSYVVSGQRLRMIITESKNKDINKPVILFLQGIECASIDYSFGTENTYTKLIYQLAEKGYTVFRVEKNGLGDSEGKDCRDNTFQEEVLIYRKALEHIKELKDHNGKNVILFGYSIGGVIAPMICDIPAIKGVIAFGTTAVKFYEYFIDNIRRYRRAIGVHEKSIEDFLITYRVFLDMLLNQGLSVEEILILEPEMKRYAVNNPYMHKRHYKFFQQLNRIDILDFWEKVKQPILLLSGKNDYVADIHEHRSLYKNLKENFQKDINYIEFPVNHFLLDDQEVFPIEIVEDIAEWLIEHEN